MTYSRAFQVLIVGTLVSASVAVVGLFTYLAWPHLSERLAIRTLLSRVEAETGNGEFAPELDAAIDSVKRFDDGRTAVEPLMQTFKNPNQNVRWAARYALLRLGPASTPLLVRTLSNGSEDVGQRTGAAWTLGWMRDRGTVPALVIALNDDDAKVRSMATWALAQMPPDSKVALQRFRELSRDPDSTQRRWAAFALSFLGADAKEAVPELTELLRDSDPDTRELATHALERIGPDARCEVSSLVSLFQAEDSAGEIQSCVARVLGAIGPDAAQAVPALTETLNAGAGVGRCAAIDALGSIGPDAAAALPKLIQCLDDEDVREAAIEAIKKIDSQVAKRLGLD